MGDGQRNLGARKLFTINNLIYKHRKGRLKGIGDRTPESFEEIKVTPIPVSFKFSNDRKLANFLWIYSRPLNKAEVRGAAPVHQKFTYNF